MSFLSPKPKPVYFKIDGLWPNTTARGLLARDQEYCSHLFGSLARGAELTAGSGALWSGLLVPCCLASGWQNVSLYSRTHWHFVYDHKRKVRPPPPSSTVMVDWALNTIIIIFSLEFIWSIFLWNGGKIMSCYLALDEMFDCAVAPPPPPPPPPRLLYVLFAQVGMFYGSSFVHTFLGLVITFLGQVMHFLAR